MVLPRLEYIHRPGGLTCLVRWQPVDESHDGHVHGGLVSAVLDEAMGHCAGRALNSPVVTTLLRVRFIGPTRPMLDYDLQVTIGALTADSIAIEAELVREEVVVAATARFRKLPEARVDWRHASSGP